MSDESSTDGERHRDPASGTEYRFEKIEGGVRVHTVLEPGGGLPKHYHPRQDEVWWVEEGEVEVTLGGTTRTLIAADGKIDVPAGTWHSLANRSEAPARAIADALPALGLEAFLTESAAAARDGLFRKGGIPTSWRGMKWAAEFLERYDHQVVMAFPPRPLQKLLIRLLG